MGGQRSAEQRVGIDLGGTAIKAGALAPDGRILARRSIPVELARGAEHVVDQMVSLARELAHGAPLPAIGVGSPGLIDRARGCVVESPNLGPMEGAPLRAALAARLDLPEERVRLENDANAAAVGEHELGAGRGVRDLAMLTLGTGIGGGLILDGELYVGSGGMAGEPGHLIVERDGPPCGCGNRGCLEQLASATAARRRAIARGLPAERPGDLELLAATARRAVGPERALLFEIGRDLGRGLGILVTLLDLRLFLIGGGFGAALDQLEPGARRGLAESTWGPRRAEIRIAPATLGPDAGWIGAALIGARALRDG